jgi:UDP-glucose 4-epimerase
VLDDLSTGRAENVPEGARFVKCDIRDEDAVRGVFAGFRPDVVNHHAAQIDVRKSVEDPAFDASVNIIGTIRLLESSVRSGVKKFIFASTGGAIYGEPPNIPADEKTPPMPISPYGTSKYAVEKYLEYYRYIYSLDYVASGTNVVETEPARRSRCRDILPDTSGNMHRIQGRRQTGDYVLRAMP